MPIADPDALYDDRSARDAILQLGWIATEPGALAEAVRNSSRMKCINGHLRLIFYDEPVFGHFQERFDKIFAEPRYTDLTANLSWFSQLYATILAKPRVPQQNAAHAAFYRRYYRRHHTREVEGGYRARQAVRHRRLGARQPMHPLRLSHYTDRLQHRCGLGRDAGVAAGRGAADCGLAHSRRWSCQPMSGKCRRSTTSDCRRRWPPSIAATTGWRRWRWARTGLRMRWRRRWPATAPRRIGLFVGTSTSGILQAELAYRARDATTGPLPAVVRLCRDPEHRLAGRLSARGGSALPGRRSSCPAPARRRRRCSAVPRA